ncbi:MFS transporter [Oscillospiraceae bacterium WX1]
MEFKQSFKIWPGQSFPPFFLSQTAVASAACIQLIALSRLLVTQTNSGFYTGLGVVTAPIPGVIVSLLAGRIGDRFSSRLLLIFFDVLRGVFVLLFAFSKSAGATLFVMLAVSFLDVFYSPARSKLFRGLMTEGELLRGSALLTGGSGGVNLLVPMLTGLFVHTFGVTAAFVISGAFYWFSALLLLKLPRQAPPVSQKRVRPFGAMAEGIIICLRSPELRRVLALVAALDVGTVAVNIAFYAYAFDILCVTSRYWGLLLSVLYGMNLFAMLLLLRYKNYFDKNPLLKVTLFLPIIALVWCMYGLTGSLARILILAAAEGLFSSLAGTLLTTRLLSSVDKRYAARVTGARDLVSSASKLIGIGAATLLLVFFPPAAVFMSSAALLLAAAFLLLAWQADDGGAEASRRDSA